MTRADKAQENFKSGLNCSQSVLLAFSDLTGLDEEKALQIAAPFGGGMGRMREVCGTVSGMLMAAGAILYNARNLTNAEKSAMYARAQELMNAFREKNGSYVCRELLAGVRTDSSPVAEERTEQYYKKRPCPLLCRDAAEILETFLRKEGVLADGCAEGAAQ